MKALPSNKERVHSVHECSEVLRAHVRTVRRWIKNGELPARKIHSQWYVTESDLRNYQRKNPE